LVATLTKHALSTALAICIASCGGQTHGPACEPSGFQGNVPTCQVAVALSLRYGDTLYVDQDKLDYIYGALKKCYQLDPLFGSASADVGFDENPMRPHVASTYPAIATSWSQGKVVTGDAKVDSLFAANGANRVDVSGGNGALYGYNVYLDEPLNLSILAGLVTAGIPDTSVRTQAPLDHGYNTWLEFDSSGISAKFAIGWGDCFNKCMYTHWYQVRIPDNAPAAINSEWGDPIPADILALLRNVTPPP
jgi:hypothetical protein